MVSLTMVLWLLNWIGQLAASGESYDLAKNKHEQHWALPDERKMPTGGIRWYMICGDMCVCVTLWSTDYECWQPWAAPRWSSSTMQINQLGNDVSLCPRMPGFNGGRNLIGSVSASFSCVDRCWSMLIMEFQQWSIVSPSKGCFVEDWVLHSM